MRWQTKVFINKFVEEKKPAPKSLTLDVGSMDVSGNLRSTFDSLGLDYVGLDMREGPNVDIVLNGHEMKTKLKEASYDIVCSFDTLEHDDKFWLTVENMKWLVKTGGYMLIGVPSRKCPLHQHPIDCWRFMGDGVQAMFEGMTDFHMEIESEPGETEESEIYAWGQKI